MIRYLRYLMLLLAAGMVVALVIMSVTGNNVVFYSHKYDETKSVSKGSIIYPFHEMFSGDEMWDAFLIIGTADFAGVVDKVRNKGGKVLRCTNVEVLRSLKNQQFFWKGEIGTPDSMLVIRRNKKIFFTSYILIDKGYVGLQSPSFGFIVPKNKEAFVDVFAKFERVYLPILII